VIPEGSNPHSNGDPFSLSPPVFKVKREAARSKPAIPNLRSAYPRFSQIVWTGAGPRAWDLLDLKSNVTIYYGAGVLNGGWGGSFKDPGTLNMVKSQGSRATLCWFNENES